jgi:hypothetical protein
MGTLHQRPRLIVAESVGRVEPIVQARREEWVTPKALSGVIVV